MIGKHQTTHRPSIPLSILIIPTVLIVSLASHVVCQNDYYEETNGEEMIVHSPSSSSSSSSNAITTKLDSLDVICGKEYMTVRAEFNGPFNGIIFSKGTYGQSKCVYVKPHSGLTHATFNVRYDECGTKPDLQGKYFENTIVIQYGTDIIEAYDEAKRLRCEWFEAYEKPATFRPAIPVADLDIIEMNFQGDEIDCWMSIQEGKGPWSNEINRIVTVGQPLTIVVAINDRKNQFDMKVKSCFAHDGIKAPIYLIDEDGCILRPNMISPFQKIRNLKGKASLISYAQFLAFKFPDSMDVQIQCTVEVCRHGCMDTCNEASSSNNVAAMETRTHHVAVEPPPRINVTSHFSMDNNKEDLLESANTNTEPVFQHGDAISLEENERQNYFDAIADYLHNVDSKKMEELPTLTVHTEEYPLELIESRLPSLSTTNTNTDQLNKPHIEPMPQQQQQQKQQYSQLKASQQSEQHRKPSANNRPSSQINSKAHHHAPSSHPARPALSPGPQIAFKPLAEPIAQVMSIPLSPIYSLPLTMNMDQHVPNMAPSKQMSSFGSLLNPFNSIKLFNKKHAYIPQLLSNYFTQKRNYLPNDNFEMVVHHQPMGHLYRTKRYIKEQQGEIGLKKGFQVVTTLDLSFSPNISEQDQMPILEGKPENVVYGICISTTYFVYILASAISFLISGIVISIFIVCKLETIKQNNRC